MEEFRRLQPERYSITEGSVSPEQIAFIQTLCAENPSVRRVLEIGFNGGMSSAAFLSARPDIEVVSFDLGAWPYGADAKRLVDEVFSRERRRHTLVLGDSTVTVPEYRSTAGAEPFDLAFVDGGHTTPVPDLDIANCLPLLRAHGFVVVDDYCAMYGSDGVIRAYDHAVQRGDLRTFAGPFSGLENRGWIVGKKTDRYKNYHLS